MNEGAFALMDCLGFKGVWNRGVTPDDIVKFMKETKDNADKSEMGRLLAAIVGPNLRICTAFVSDSVAISATPSQKAPLAEWEQGYLLFVVVAICLELMKRFSGTDAPVPLAFRGCVTFGPHVVQDTFFLGPAVDEAASLAQESQGAFVWLTPEAHRKYSVYLRDFPTTAMQSLHKIPSEQMIQRAESALNVAVEYHEPSEEQKKVVLAKWRATSHDKKYNAALLIFQWLLSSYRIDFVLPEYPMELKSGGVLQVTVLNLLCPLPDVEHSRVINRILSGFDANKNLDVLLKRQNTQRLLLKGSADTKDSNKRAEQLRDRYIKEIDAALA